jgi:hypothetical protein
VSDWDASSAKMDEDVDAHLSDTISYSTDEGATFNDIAGFVLPFAEGLALGPIDPSLGSRYRVKVRKSLVAAPDRTHRLRQPKLGAGTFRPSGDDPDEQGRYWIFDIQKVED